MFVISETKRNSGATIYLNLTSFNIRTPTSRVWNDTTLCKKIFLILTYFVFCSKTRGQSVPEGSWSTLICISNAGCCVLLCCTGRFSQQQNFPAWRLRFFSIPLQQFFFSRFRTIDSGKILVASRPLSESNWNNLASRRKISSHIMLSIISTFECSFSWLCWGSLDDPAFFQDPDTEF